MLIFPHFELLVFIAKKGVFFVLEYDKRHFPGLSRLRTSCFYSLERRFFALKYCKRPLTGLCCLKKKVGKMAIFGPKPWVNPYGKMSIFRLFELLDFIA